MNIDLAKYRGPCGCGMTHTVGTKLILIESGASAGLREIARSLALPKRCTILCDWNTEPYADICADVLSDLLHPIRPVIVLNPDNLHADERAVERVAVQLPADTGWLLACGAGTIHDIARYTAHRKSIPFVSFPTAASVDGFVSTVCAMTWNGFKSTLPGVAPVAVAADTDIFRDAPYRLTASGIGDVLGKYISLADWELSGLVTGEVFCPRIAALTREAADNVRSSLEAIRSADAGACEKLMFALLMSGLSMQMWGNSRPASGAEHHLSHLWEMEVLNPRLDALHGEKVGVGLCTVLPLYKSLAPVDLSSHLTFYQGLPHGLLREKFGPLYDSVLSENTPDILESVDTAALTEQSGRIGTLLDSLPDAESLRSDMKAAGCRTEPGEIGLAGSCLADSLSLSPFVRNRLTLMRLTKLTDIRLY